jgi:predicted ribosomally synthesized peptide with SipW-like signal peptide
MQKKSLAATLGAVVLIGAIGIGSTFAFLSQTASVKNTFTVGKVTMDLKETKASRYNADTDAFDENGTGAYGADTASEPLTETSNTYTNLYEGETVFKNPTVIIGEGSLPSWLFVQIEYNADQFAPIDVDETEWALVDTKENGDLTQLIYAHKELTEAEENYEIFDDVTFNGLAGKDDVDDIIVRAFAIQQYEYTSYTEVYEDGVVDFGND